MTLTSVPKKNILNKSQFLAMLKAIMNYVHFFG